MISPQYVDRLEQRIEELASELRSHKAALEGLQDERDAMAAHVERIKAAAKAELLAAVRELDLTTNNGDIRRDAEKRAGWNQCIRELRRQAKEVTP